jgi:hypothetical protein
MSVIVPRERDGHRRGRAGRCSDAAGRRCSAPDIPPGRRAGAPHDEVIDRDQEVWPVCDRHQAGIHPRLIAGRAVWCCSPGDHVLRGIGAVSNSERRVVELEVRFWPVFRNNAARALFPLFTAIVASAIFFRSFLLPALGIYVVGVSFGSILDVLLRRRRMKKGGDDSWYYYAIRCFYGSLVCCRSGCSGLRV